MTEIAPLAGALVSAGHCLAFHARDWSHTSRDAWLWGILCGWDAASMDECADRFAWSDLDVAELRRMRAAVRAVTGVSDDE